MDTIQEFKAHQNVFPGDQIRIETNIIKRSEDDIYFNARSGIDGKECSEISFIIRQSSAESTGTFIHPTASVHPSAILGKGVHIGPYCIVNEGVSIGDNTSLKAHVMVDQWCQIGQNNTFEYGAVIGSQVKILNTKVSSLCKNWR